MRGRLVVPRIWHGRVGYMIATNLDLQPGPVARPVVVYTGRPIFTARVSISARAIVFTGAG